MASIFLVTDVAFPLADSPAGQRLIDNQKRIQTILEGVDGLRVLYEDIVDANSSKWRLTQSIAAPFSRAESDKVRLILCEHIWPRGDVSTSGPRASFHLRLLEKLVSQWPSAFVLMVQRETAGLGSAAELSQQLNVGRRQCCLRPLALHYTPLQGDPSCGASPIQGCDTDRALIVAPKPAKPPDGFLHLLTKEIMDSDEPVSIPHFVCKIIARGEHIVQFGAFSCESTLGIVAHCADYFVQ